MEGKLITIVDISSSSKMGHVSTTGRGGASTTGAILTHHICVGEGGDFGSGNGAKDADNSIVFSSSLSHWVQTTKQMKEYIIKFSVVFIKSNRGSEVSREHDIHHANATKVILQDFVTSNHLVPKNLEGGYK